ncbi:YD repeat-containing protein [Lutibacter oceani]|uniref:YD repeat-containing protein n=2 Tax=Lutibacter oceani TaxID=1853311 RepID=A0A3D9RQG3_9FLAO|nr:YD repeat-containing protein [Lutibacter oceani]
MRYFEQFSQMKKLNTLLGIILGLTLICCSSDSDENSNSQKHLTNINYSYLDGQIRLTQNLVYDANNNLIEINDENGLVMSSYDYNGSDRLIKVVDFQYNDDGTNFEFIKNISYNNDNKISNIEIIDNIYNAEDGKLIGMYNYNKVVNYGDNTITVVTDGIGSETVILSLSNNWITGVKIIRKNTLQADMVFTYDNEGNCISGSGLYQPGLYDTTDIDLNVIYGNEEKNPHFNAFFYFNVLCYNNSFFNLKRVLIEQQGTKYPKKIQWYQFEGWNYRDYHEYSFDIDGSIISKKTNVFNTNTYGEIVSYTWE